jgi:hypothetical protein
MRPVAFGEALSAGTRLTLFSDNKPDRCFTVIKFWMDATSGVVLELKTGVPSYQVEDEEGRIHLLIHLPIEEENESCKRSSKRESERTSSGGARFLVTVFRVGCFGAFL